MPDPLGAATDPDGDGRLIESEREKDTRLIAAMLAALGMTLLAILPLWAMRATSARGAA